MTLLCRLRLDGESMTAALRVARLALLLAMQKAVVLLQAMITCCIIAGLQSGVVRYQRLVT